jgi:hypothetical protein
MFAATANTGYEVDTWVVDGNSVQTGGSSYLLNNVTAPHTVYVTFSRVLWAISGHIYEPDGNTPVSDVVITTDDNDVNTVVDSNGFYVLWVEHGWSGEVTPQKEGHFFEPNRDSYTDVNRTYSDMDYTASLMAFLISGSVFEPDYLTGINDVNVAAEDGGGWFTSKYGGGSYVTDTNGHYEIWVDYNWSGRVFPSKYAYAFDPDFRQYEDVNADHTIGQDYIGLLRTFAISGEIRNECNVPISSVVVDADAGGGYDTSDANGHYELWVDYSWTGLVTPAKPNFTFEPNKMEYTNVLFDIADHNYIAYNISDLDCDGAIGWGDVAVIAENWLLIGPNIPGDLYGDDVIDFRDIGALGAAW